MYETRSTKQNISIEICSKCHPFYTGKQKLVDTAGRVDRFEALRKKSGEIKKTAKPKASKKADKPAVETKDAKAALAEIKKEIKADTVDAPAKDAKIDESADK